MKYIVEDRDCNIIEVFYSPDDREEWTEKHCTKTYDNRYFYKADDEEYATRVYWYEEA